MIDFLDEAFELVGSIDWLARAWADNPENHRYPQSLLENLHTLKGGALLCGLSEVCERVHQLEDLLAEFQDPGRKAEETLFVELNAQRDRLSALLRVAGENSAMDPAANSAPGRDRMVSVAQVLPRLEAGVQLMAHMLGKAVELHADDTDLALETGVARRLAMALEHVLRDAVCHGIEAPEHRRANGKPELGRIDVRVSRQDDELVISVEDDGQGIDVARIRELARVRGLLAGDAEVRDADCAQVVFAPGLSTSEQVGPAFGRGVGLSAARTGIARLGGRMWVDFLPVSGARFVMRIPWGIRIVGAWTMLVRKDRYAVPDDLVEEDVPVQPGTLQGMAHGGVFEHAGAAWELWFPGELLGFGRAGGARPADGALLLLRCRGRRIALYAAVARRRQDIVVGAAQYGAQDGAGASLATLSDDGSPVVLLNPCALLRG